MVEISHRLFVFITLSAISILFVLFIVLTSIKNVHANFEQQDWEFSKPILSPPNLTASGFLGFEPDEHIYTNSADNLTDLRVIKEFSQTEVPYELLIEHSLESYELLQADMRDITNVEGSHTAFMVKVSPRNSLHNQLEIITSSDNFVRKVKIETINELLTWSTAEDNAQIYDIAVSTGVPNHRNTKLTYPTSSSDFLRITIFNDNKSPLKIQGAILSLLQETPAKYKTYPSLMSSQEKAAKSDSSQIIIDLKSEGIPTSRLNIFTFETNFNRKVNLESSSDAKTWTLVSQDHEVFVYDTAKIQRQQLDLLYPEVTNRYLRLTFLNGDSPPVNIKAIDIQGLRRLLIFEGSPDSRYNVYYGNLFEKVTPKYDLEQIISHVDIENINLANLGKEQVNLSFEQKSIEPLSGRYPWLLPSAVTTLIIILGLVLIRILRLTMKENNSA